MIVQVKSGYVGGEDAAATVGAGFKPAPTAGSAPMHRAAFFDGYEPQSF
ncbi:MAG: hypothetical protein HYS61_04645 [Acidobacteria bacterium]|nr:hypothetical protein [Acidobacteriota bacterium]